MQITAGLFNPMAIIALAGKIYSSPGKVLSDMDKDDDDDISI